MCVCVCVCEYMRACVCVAFNTILFYSCMSHVNSACVHNCYCIVRLRLVDDNIFLIIELYSEPCIITCNTTLWNVPSLFVCFVSKCLHPHTNFYTLLDMCSFYFFVLSRYQPTISTIMSINQCHPSPILSFNISSPSVT